MNSAQRRQASEVNLARDGDDKMKRWKQEIVAAIHSAHSKWGCKVGKHGVVKE